MKVQNKIIMGLLMAGVTASCGKKKDDTTTASATQAESVADLKLSTALQIDVPDKLESAAGGSASTGLTALLAGKKSSEACRVMENTNNIFSNLKEIGGMFCHLEVESDQMKFGTKYNVAVKGDAGLIDQSMTIWVDNSDASALKVFMCEEGKLKQTFTVSGFGGEGKVKGSLSSSHSGTHEGEVSSGGINMDFDFTTEGVKLVTAKMKHKNEGGEHAGTFRMAADIKIVETGLSAIKMSSSGTRGSDTMNDQGAVLFNGTLGQALFSGTGTYQSHSYDFTSRSTFDSDGFAVASSTAPAEVVIDKATLPEKLTEAFSPNEPAGWDCSGATETITIDMTDAAKKSAHDACNGDHGKNFSNCFGEGFEYGEHE